MPVRFPILPTLYATLLTIPLMTVGEATLVHAQVQCWAARQHEGPVMDKRAGRQVKAMNAAEAIVKGAGEFLDAPVPVRMRSTMATSLSQTAGSRLIVRAYPEQASSGIRLWRGECGIIPQADRVGEPIGRVSIFFNHLSRDMFMGQDEIPKLTGTVEEYPEYNGWVLISKGGRLPWVPQTLRDRLDRLEAGRAKRLADWRRAKTSRKVLDQATVERTAASFRRTDPEGSDKYVANMKRLTAEIRSAQVRDAEQEAHLLRVLNECRAYRASFTGEQLAMPAVWADTDGAVRKTMEARINEWQDLSVDDREREGEIREQSRRLQQEAAVSDDDVTALRLRAQARDILQDADQIRQDHMDRVALEEDALRSAYELTNLKPGLAEQALAYKMDPTFPDRRQPGKIQVIAVSVSMPSEEDVLQTSEQAARKTWLDRVKSSLDYAALAALLD